MEAPLLQPFVLTPVTAAAPLSAEAALGQATSIGAGTGAATLDPFMDSDSNSNQDLRSVVLIGCRDVELIPISDEGCLGDNFYDFFYEVDKVVVAGPPKQPILVPSGGHGAPSPKRARVDQILIATEEASDSEQVYGSQTDSVKQHQTQTMMPVVTEKEQDSEEDSAMGNELMIETMVGEHEESLSGMDSSSNKWLGPCSVLQNNNSYGSPTPVSNAFSNTLPYDAWPSLPTITEIVDDSSSPVTEIPDYSVQSPDSSPMEGVTTVENESLGERFSIRLQAHSNVHVMDKVANMSKKRNLEEFGFTKQIPLRHSTIQRSSEGS